MPIFSTTMNFLSLFGQCVSLETKLFIVVLNILDAFLTLGFFDLD
jgi:hypothetical protein